MNKSTYMKKFGLWLCAIAIWLLASAVALDSPIAALIMLIASAVFIPPFKEDLIEYGAKGKYLTIGAVIIIFSCLIFNIVDDPKVQTEVVEQRENVEIQEAVKQVEKEAASESEEVAIVVESEPEIEIEPIVEPEPDIPEDDSMVESKSSDMDFSICLQQQAVFAEAVSSSGNYNVIPIVDSNVLSIVKFCTNDDSVIHTCSAPDNKMVVTKSTNREGC